MAKSECTTALQHAVDISPSDKRRIAYIPIANATNEYVVRMQEILARYGKVVKFKKPKETIEELARAKLIRYDLTIINWFENDFIDARTGRLSLIGTTKVIFKTLYARCLTRHLAFVRHNVYPHNTAPGHGKKVEKVLDWYEHLFDTVFIHSGAHAVGRRVYCPHPLYRRTQPSATRPATMDGIPPDYFVVFGRIARYKHIAELMKAFPDEQNLLIVGSVEDADYSEELATIQRKNIFFRPGFLSEQEAQQIIMNSRAMLLSHAGDNAVVSGSFFYALSMAVPVVAVSTPFLQWAAPLVGPEFLMLADSVETLPSKLQTTNSRAELEALKKTRIDQDFGDDAIARSLEAALGIAAVRSSNSHIANTQ